MIERACSIDSLDLEYIRDNIASNKKPRTTKLIKIEDKDEKRQGGFSFLVSARYRKPRRRKENPMTTYEIDREHGLDIFYSWKMMIELKPQVIIIN